MTPHEQHPQLLQFDNLKKIADLTHFASTRRGGVSEGEYASFNLGNLSDDNPDHVWQNREKLARMLDVPLSRLIIPQQTHEADIAIITDVFFAQTADQKSEYLRAKDACITQCQDVVLCVTTADCVPILLYDAKQKAIGSIHAGWRSTVKRIVEQTIMQMSAQYGTNPADIIAAIGPAINVEEFEVGDEVVEAFISAGVDLSTTSTPRNANGKKHLDLKEINRQELIRLGVQPTHIEVSPLSTYSTPEQFFSARRQTIHCGRMLSGICLKGSERTKQKA